MDGMSAEHHRKKMHQAPNNTWASATCRLEVLQAVEASTCGDMKWVLYVFGMWAPWAALLFLRILYIPRLSNIPSSRIGGLFRACAELASAQVGSQWVSRRLITLKLIPSFIPLKLIP